MASAMNVPTQDAMMSKCGDYNIFVVYDCVKRKPILVTSSARKAKKALHKGIRVDVWNMEEIIACVYSRDDFLLDKYIMLEKQYIARKQEQATKRNQRRQRKNKSGGNQNG